MNILEYVGNNESIDIRTHIDHNGDSEVIAIGRRHIPQGWIIESVLFYPDFDLDEKIQLVADLRYTAITPYFSPEDKARWELRADILEFAIYFLKEN